MPSCAVAPPVFVRVMIFGLERLPVPVSSNDSAVGFTTRCGGSTAFPLRLTDGLLTELLMFSVAVRVPVFVG